MTTREAIDLLVSCAYDEDGVVYASRWGAYPSAEMVDSIISALRHLHHDLRGEALIDRRLATALYLIATSLRGNLPRSHELGIEVRPDFDVDLIRLEEAGLALLEDWERFD